MSPSFLMTRGQEPLPRSFELWPKRIRADTEQEPLWWKEYLLRKPSFSWLKSILVSIAKSHISHSSHTWVVLVYYFTLFSSHDKKMYQPAGERTRTRSGKPSMGSANASLSDSGLGSPPAATATVTSAAAEMAMSLDETFVLSPPTVVKCLEEGSSGSSHITPCQYYLRGHRWASTPLFTKVCSYTYRGIYLQCCADPDPRNLWLMDPDPIRILFFSSVAFKMPTKNFFSTFFFITYFLKVHLHHFSKI